MADILKFQTDEFEILETFDHEEEIQRPESLSFYTLDEQINDFFEKMLPVKLTRSEEKEIKKVRDRIRLVYEKTIAVTDTDYVIQRLIKSVNVPWIKQVYSGFEYSEYSYKKEWEPLFAKDQKSVPNYYPRLINALPVPFKNTGEGRPAVPGVLVDKEGKDSIKILDSFKATKTVINDDGTYNIVTEEFKQAQDTVNSSGFYLEERPYEIARPMDHPFLKSRKPVYIDSSASLLDAYPSIETILEHAIPSTQDPYTEGKKYLDVYDVSLDVVPWNSWKERFPPAEYRDVPIPVKEIPVNKEENEKPSEGLFKYYSGWNSAYDPRFWIMNQIDSGLLIAKLLLSNANSVGSLSAYTFPSIQYTYPPTEAEICQKLTSSFDSFLESGLYRTVKGVGQCIPVTTILQEKSVLTFSDRESWKETTKLDIIKDYEHLFKKYAVIKETVQKYEKFELKKESERRTDVLAILRDTREDEDKAEALERLTRDLELKDRLFFDAAQEYVLCSHTLELLRGALKDRFGFYAEWTTTIEGARICKFCGEEINRDTLVAIKEYDSEGHVTMEYEPLNEEIHTIISLNSIKELFDVENGGESLLYVVLSFLQIIPSEQQLVPVLQLIRSFTASLKNRAQGGKISKDDRDYTEGLFGIAGIIILLQTHNPFLVPKRKIGQKDFNSSGYPRDSDDPASCHTLKSVFQLLNFILKTFPVPYKGGITAVLRKYLKDREEVTANALKFIRVFYEKFKPAFESARERYVEPEKDIPKNQFTLPLELIEVGPERSGNECSIFKTGVSMKMKRVPVLTKPVPLDTKYPGPYEVLDVQYKPPIFEEMSKTDIRKKTELGLSGFPFGDFVKNADGSAYIILSHQILSVLRNSSFSLKEQQKFRYQLSTLSVKSTSLFRDSAKAIFLDLLATIKPSQPLVRLILTAIKNDITFKMILTDKKAAEQEELELRAKERNYIKAALRRKNDVEREIYQQLLALGISEFLVTNKDREKFFQEYTTMDEIAEDEEIRDYIENGNLPVAQNGQEMEVDYGDYGDRAVRDYDDYTTQYQFSDD
jgi:hypothetical protein